MPKQITAIPSESTGNCGQANTQDECTFSYAGAARTLISFALIAYNQEKYIREAVASAFAQTYEPLEIILSDDCSTDQTFEIIQEMAKSYRGSKKIIARQTHSNIGTLRHVVDVASVAAGQLIILAAGDDISKKERTDKIVVEWLSTGAWGFYSKFDRISEGGKIISESEDPSTLFPPDYRLRHYLSNAHAKSEIVHGATSAYDKRIFNYLELTTDDYILSEDGVLSVLLNMLGKEIRMINQSLVSYRENEQSLTNSAKNRKISLKIVQNDEKKIERFSRSHANRCELFIRLNTRFGINHMELNTEQILIDLIKLRMKEKWWDSGLHQRLVYLKNNFNYTEVKWALPRLLPKKIFFIIKISLNKLLRRNRV